MTSASSERRPASDAQPRGEDIQMDRAHIAMAMAIGIGAWAPVENPAWAAPRADGGFACGLFGPNLTTNPSAHLGTIATAMFTTPGESVPVAFLQQGPWFLLDSYGSGPLMGCGPATSQWNTDIAPRLNSFNGDGLLQSQTVLVSDGQSGQTPVVLKFQYLAANPRLVASAEQLCFGAVAGSTAKYHMAFDYDRSQQLARLSVTADPGCSDYAGTYSYIYGNSQVPNLPTKVEFVDGNGTGQTTTFDYRVDQGMLREVRFGGGASLSYGYGGTLLTQININSPGQTVPLAISYSRDLQWLSALDADHHWGLTMTYQDGKVVKALQDTGCPGVCQPSIFTYLGAMTAEKETLADHACFVASRQEHIAAGHATAQNGNVYAKGSGAFIGADSLGGTIPLREGSKGIFYFDWSCR
jgi:hypothetical protein